MNDPIHLDMLDICTSQVTYQGDKTNCGVCGKCGRFLLVAEVPGKLKEFTGTFDLDNFNRNRRLIVRGIVKRSHGGKINANDREHLQFLTGHNAKLSVTARLSGRISALNSRLRRR